MTNDKKEFTPQHKNMSSTQIDDTLRDIQRRLGRNGTECFKDIIEGRAGTADSKCRLYEKQDRIKEITSRANEPLVQQRLSERFEQSKYSDNSYRNKGCSIM